MEKHGKSSWWKVYTEYVRSIVFPSNETCSSDISFWRNEIFLNILVFLAPLSLIALIPGVYMAFVGGVFVIGVVDLLAFLAVLSIITVPEFSLEVRKFILIFVLYCLSFVLLYYLGEMGPGLLFLLFLTVISTVVFSSVAGYYSAGLNAVICSVIAVLNFFNVVGPGLTDYTLGAWIAVYSNLVLLSFTSAKCLDILFVGLTASLEANKISQQKLIKGHRLYQLISQINQNILHVKDENSLFQSSCETAFKIGEFKMVWISIFDKEQKWSKIIQFRGIPEGELDHFSESFLSSGIQDLVIQTESYFFSNNIENETGLDELKDLAFKNNLRSFIVLPITRGQDVIGSFNLFSSVPGFFNLDEIKPLQEATSNISFAIGVFEKEKLRKQAEELVAKTQNRFRALIEKSSDLTTMTSRDGEIIYASPSVSRVLGYELSDFKKLPPTALIHPDDFPNVIQNIQDIIQTPGKSFYSQHRLLHKSGNWLLCEGTITNLLNEKGLEALVSNFRDISETNRLEMRHVFDENNLNALINNTNDLMWSVDRNYRLITSNKPYASMLESVFGRPIKKGDDILILAMTPEMHSTFKQAYDRAFAGKAFTETVRFEYPNEMWAEISFYPIREGNDVMGTACHFRDITPSKKAEEELRLSAAHLAEAQRVAKMGSWNYDCVSDKLTWSDELYTIFSVDHQTFTESLNSFLKCIDSSDRERVMQTSMKAQQNGEPFTIEYIITLQNREKRVIRDSANAELNVEGQVVRLFGTAQDITDKKLAEEEREKMVANIIQHSKNLEQFASIVSHNLRAPVANILGLSNVLKNKITMADRDRVQELLFTATSRLDEVLQDLSKILQVRSEINEYKETVCFQNIVDVVQSSIQNLIEKERVEIITDFSATENIISIKSYIHSIFYNLISNSIKYRQHESSPVISIESRRSNDKIVLVFKDNGLGLDLEKYSSKLFGLYKRFHLNIEGKGLGLFMVKTQIETLGGTISVESEMGKGTTFIIELPV